MRLSLQDVLAQLSAYISVFYANRKRSKSDLNDNSNSFYQVILTRMFNYQ